jgi:hypothetical protein
MYDIAFFSSLEVSELNNIEKNCLLLWNFQIVNMYLG